MLRNRQKKEVKASLSLSLSLRVNKSTILRHARATLCLLNTSLMQLSDTKRPSAASYLTDLECAVFMTHFAHFIHS